jgi:hypothetical protein
MADLFMKFHPHLSLILIALSSWCLLVGCEHRHSIGAGFELRQQEAWNPDAHPAISLYYKGKEVWHVLFWGEGSPQQFVHDDIFVYESPVPDKSGFYDYSVSPQFYAVRAGSTPILLSQRILGKALGAGQIFTVTKMERVDEGVRLVFGYSQNEGRNVTTTNDASWSDITKWVQEADASVRGLTTPLGTYRLLPPK